MGYYDPFGKHGLLLQHLLVQRSTSFIDIDRTPSEASVFLRDLAKKRVPSVGTISIRKGEGSLISNASGTERKKMDPVVT